LDAHWNQLESFEPLLMILPADAYTCHEIPNPRGRPTRTHVS
jgi:hypothetical protein